MDHSLLFNSLLLNMFFFYSLVTDKKLSREQRKHMLNKKEMNNK